MRQSAWANSLGQFTEVSGEGLPNWSLTVPPRTRSTIKMAAMRSSKRRRVYVQLARRLSPEKSGCGCAASRQLQGKDGGTRVADQIVGAPGSRTISRASHASKGGRRWRYYVSRAALTGRTKEAGSVVRIPASEIENRVARAVGPHLVGRASAIDGCHINHGGGGGDQAIPQLELTDSFMRAPAHLVSWVSIFRSVSVSVDISPLALGSENDGRATRVKDAKHRRSRRARSARP